MLLLYRVYSCCPTRLSTDSLPPPRHGSCQTVGHGDGWMGWGRSGGGREWGGGKGTDSITDKIGRQAPPTTAVVQPAAVVNSQCVVGMFFDSPYKN